MPGGRWPDPRSNKLGLTIGCADERTQVKDSILATHSGINLEMRAHVPRAIGQTGGGKWLIAYALVSIYANLSCSALQEEFVPRDELPYYQSLDALRTMQVSYLSSFDMSLQYAKHCN